MPRTPLNEENRTGEGGSRFPKLELDKGEKCRGVLLEQPWSEWVHILKAPAFENGVPKMTEVTRRGVKTEGPEVDFISQPFCLGDRNVLDAKGVDEKNCPVCERAREDPNLKPVRRYAVNFVRYHLRGGTWEPMVPLSLEIAIWRFNARMFDDLLDLANKIGPLHTHDVTLEVEDTARGKRFGTSIAKMSFELDPAWTKFPDGQERIIQAWNEPGNRATDEQLRDACGRESSRNQMQEDVNLVLRRWAQYNAVGNGTADPFAGGQPQQQRDLTAGMSDLLAAAAGTPAAAEHPGGLGAFTATEEQVTAGVEAAQAAVRQDPGAMAAMTNPFAAAQADGTAQSAITTSTAVQGAGPLSPTVSPAVSPAPAASPVSSDSVITPPAAQPAQPEAERRKRSFSDILQGL